MFQARNNRGDGRRKRLKPSPLNLMKPWEREEGDKLASDLSDRSRKVKRAGDKYLVPLKFDDQGNPLTQESFNIRKHLKELSLLDLRFLSEWRASGWDAEKAANKALVEPEHAKRLVRKLQVFKDEEERIKALADIPSVDFIKAKHTENVFEGKLDDSQRDSLKELAKIVGAYKTTSVTLTQNVFNLPPLSPEQESKLKEVYDAIAVEAKESAA